MLVYYALAAVCVFFAELGFIFEKRNKTTSILLYLVSVLLVCLFAGFRDLSVGTDTSSYAYDSYIVSKQSSFSFFSHSPRFSKWPLFYRCICWWSSNLFGFAGYLFCIELVIVLPVLIACRSFLKNWMALGFAVYMIIFYPMSFNLMRQMCGMGFILLAFILIEKKKYVGSVCMIILGLGFHFTALLGLLLYPLILFSKNKFLASSLKKICTCIFGLAIICILPSVLNFVTATTGAFESYTINAVGGDGLHCLLVTVLCFAIFSIFPYWEVQRNSFVSAKELNTDMTIVALFGLICFSLSLFSFWFYRIGIEFLYIIILLIPNICMQIKNRRERTLALTFSLLLLLFWSLDYYEIVHSNNVVPYIMSIG